MSQRRSFIFGKPFRDEQDRLDENTNAALVTDTQNFDDDYNDLGPDGLPSSYDFKQVHLEHGRFTVHQVRACKRSYRLLLLIPTGLNEAHWIHLYKKGKDWRERNQEGFRRAGAYWEQYIRPKLKGNA
jgi:hypothetical protein